MHKESKSPGESVPVPIALLERRIYLIRGHNVMLSQDLAELYGVSTSALNQSVKRNRARFPEDFMFQLSKGEVKNLKSQFVISSWGGMRRALPYAFTQEGVAMLSSVLHSQRAIAVNIAVMRAFVKLREIMATHKDLAHKIEALERKYGEHGSLTRAGIVAANPCTDSSTIRLRWPLIRATVKVWPRPKSSILLFLASRLLRSAQLPAAS